MTLRHIVTLSFIFSAFSIAQKFTKAIEDNSYFIEEAYNQEEGVVQHIPNSYFSSGGSDIIATFTQEWPIGSQQHQLSYTVPYSSLNGMNGIGDVVVNYRYQLIRSEDGLAVSPRFSVIIPSGNEKTGLGDGVVGYQINLPVSMRWSDHFVSHFNAGAMLLPGIKNPTIGKDNNLDSYFVGGSGIFLTTTNFNIMLELLHTISKTVTPTGGTEYTGESIVSPGIRFAIDISDLQIVPGVALPILFTPGQQKTGILLYLSFEHFF